MEHTIRLGPFTCIVAIDDNSANITVKDKNSKVVASGLGITVSAAQQNACEATKNDAARRALEKAHLPDE